MRFVILLSLFVAKIYSNCCCTKQSWFRWKPFANYGGSHAFVFVFFYSYQSIIILCIFFLFRFFLPLLLLDCWSIAVELRLCLQIVAIGCSSVFAEAVFVWLKKKEYKSRLVLAITSIAWKSFWRLQNWKLFLFVNIPGLRKGVMRRGRYVLSFVFGFMMFGGKESRSEGLLYPRESETREVKSLDGIWNFVKSNETAPTEGIRDKWYLNDLNKVNQWISFLWKSSVRSAFV